MDLLRFATAGSVDDGKSTLIGRLLHDTKQIFEDQLQAVERSSMQRGYDYVNLALLTDGLRAEREQGITIDVAYRYFATPHRKFIIADTPGHVQYTRNMVTGASTANLSLLLIDARRGIVEQTRLHAFIATLMRTPHVVVCVNKMDLVDWDQSVYTSIKDEFRRFAARLDVADLTFIPISALHGDNVVDRSPNMPWYRGLPVLTHLEEVHVASDRNLIDCRFPVQYVIRPYSNEHHDYRALAGQVLGGVFKPGDEVVVLPSGLESRIREVDSYDGPVAEAFPPMSVAIRLEDDLDVSRGDMLCRPGNQPHVGQHIEAMVCWMADRPIRRGDRLAVKHTTRWTRAVVREIRYRLDVNTLHRHEGVEALALNEIGRVAFQTTTPLMYDSYRRSRTTGSFILVDEATDGTVGAGMMLDAPGGHSS